MDLSVAATQLGLSAIILILGFHLSVFLQPFWLLASGPGSTFLISCLAPRAAQAHLGLHDVSKLQLPDKRQRFGTQGPEGPCCRSFKRSMPRANQQTGVKTDQDQGRSQFKLSHAASANPQNSGFPFGFPFNATKKRAQVSDKCRRLATQDRQTIPISFANYLRGPFTSIHLQHAWSCGFNTAFEGGILHLQQPKSQAPVRCTRGPRLI